MQPLLQLSLTLLILLVFIAVLAIIISVKFDKLLSSLSRPIKLEFYDPIGKICLVGLILIAALFLICFMEGAGLELVRSFLKPDLEPHTINATMAFSIVALTFIGNLIVLSLLAKQRGK
jgi:hypothetical protein